MGTHHYNRSCGAVRPDAVRDDAIGSGEFRGRSVEVRAIVGTDPQDAVAINIAGGICDGDDTATSDWSFGFGVETPTDRLRAIACESGMPGQPC